ncbi:MAG TPA: zinc-dependent metalloprotease [Egibacteraceae bacterium]|nr:zinc-dependent metalloprotease [Egibacteraceae bacterium]
MSDPFGGGFDPRMFQNVPLFRELAKVMSWTGGPVNWDLATDTAMAIAATPQTLPAAAGAGDSEFRDAVSTAELWLDAVTQLPAIDGPALSMTAAEWTRQAATSTGLGVYLEPVARGMSASLSDELPAELAGFGAQMNQAMESLSAMLYGVQAGTVAGNLADQLLGVYDLGLPTLDPRTVGTVGDTAQQFAGDYGFDQVEFRYWLALREAAHRRMFAGVSWLRPAVADLIGQFASQASFDLGAMMEGMGGISLDPSNPEALREALSSPDAFRIEPTTEQRATLRRLQAVVALVDGWGETMVAAAAEGRLTQSARIGEAMRRRRAEKGPGERALEQLLGLDLKPADVRVGPAFCAAVITARGREGLDRVWQDASHLPTADELAEPSRWLVRMAAVEIEAELDGDDG